MYDSTFEKYPYVFTKDYLIAAQIAQLNNDEERAYKWVLSAVAQGYKCRCIEELPIFELFVLSEKWMNLKEREKVLHAQHLTKIDNKVRLEFHNRFKIEQESKSDRSIAEDIYNINFNRIRNLMEEMIFPSERQIGLDDDSLFPTKRGGKLNSCSAGNSKVIPTLLHVKRPIEKIGMDKFMTAIKTGNLHPNQFGSIYTFEANKVSSVYRERPLRSNLEKLNFNFAFGNQSKDLDQVNLDRQKFGICTLEVAKSKGEIAKKYGIRVSFGYK